ncbi:MAG: HEPN domain-containing protein [Phycisphaeraceae bacterium]
MSNDPESPSVRALRRRWKPRKEQLAESGKSADLGIRLHRAWSWMARIEQLGESKLVNDDDRLIYSWIALNSLYGRWDSKKREPMPDWKTLTDFTSLLFRLDQDKTLESLLIEHKKLVASLLEDAYLSQYFWEEPSERRARQAQNSSRRMGGMYIEKRFPMVLDEALKRVYLARCQLVHGAATYKGQLNRTALRRCARFLALLLPAASLILIDHAPDEGWGDMCYPPMS